MDFKTDKKEVLKYLKPTDLNQAQSDPYRRMSANLYRTKEKDRFYHIHGSLDATTCLEMIGLPAFVPGLKTMIRLLIFTKKVGSIHSR